MPENIEGTKATLLPLGIPLLNSSDISWSLTSGVQPYIGTYDIPADSVGDVMEMAKEGVLVEEGKRGNQRLEMNIFTLLIETAGGNKLEVKDLSVMDFPPGENPYISRIRLADKRWLWPYRHLLRRYNIRRQIGNRRIQRRDEVQEMEEMVPSVFFAQYSLKQPDKPTQSMADVWTAWDILKDILGDLDDSHAYEKRDGAIVRRSMRWLGMNILRTREARAVLEGIAVENLEIDAAGDDAVAQALSFMPGIKLWIDVYGSVIIDALQGGRESYVVEHTKPEVVGGGHTKFMDNSLTRPSEIIVLFTREHELRFDYLEKSPDGVVLPRLDEDMGEHRLMENVVPIPDFELEVENETLCQGTWITMNQALLAWGVPPAIRLKSGAPTLDYDLLLKAFLPFQDIFAAIGLVGQLQVDADWPPRISVFQENFRRTFRINPFWWDRILSIKAQALSVVDPVSGTRAPAEVYTDYSIVPGLRGFLKRTLAGSGGGTLATLGHVPSHAYFINVFGYPRGSRMNNGGNRFDDNTKACPCKLVIADHQQGIVTFQYLIDPYRTMEMILPSPVGVKGKSGIILSNNRYPLCTPTRLEAPIGWDMVNQYATQTAGGDPTAEEISLLADHKVAIVLTAIPASPNSEISLYPVFVKPEDVQVAFGQGGVGEKGAVGGTGPPMEVRVGAQIVKAQVAWDDKRADDIEKAFGLKGGKKNFRDLDRDSRWNGVIRLLRGLVLNESYRQAPNPRNQVASLDVVAAAVAARVWAAKLSRYEGGATGDMNSNLEPFGWTESVTHTLKSDGAAQTSYRIPPDIPAIDLFQYLDANTRSLILNMVVDPKSL